MELSLTEEKLYDVCQPVPEGTDVTEILQEMARILVQSETGVGLAANQVGRTERIILIRTREYREMVINPQIIKVQCGMVASEEGCLSFPDTLPPRNETVTLQRHKQVTLVGFNPKWKPIKVKLRGLPSRVAQHEIDHLDGITIFKRKELQNAGNILVH